MTEQELAELAEVEPAFVRRGELPLSFLLGPAADRIPRPNGLEPLGPVELKGVAQPLEVFRALA